MLRTKALWLALAGVGALGLSSAAFADNGMGPYVGAQGGYAWVDYGQGFEQFNQSVVGNSTDDEDGIAGRALVGWQFNPYIAVETGYTWFSDNEYKGSFSDASGNYVRSKFDISTEAWDIVAKGILPVSVMTGCPNPVSLYAKAGSAYVMTDMHYSAAASGPAAGGYRYGSTSQSDKEWVPVAGVGVAYNFNNNLSADLSYTHYFGQETSISDNDISAPRIDFVALGLNYRFSMA